MIEKGVQDSIATQAAQWYVEHREGEIIGRRREAFMHWLRASPQHVAEYLAVSGIGGDLPAAARRSRVSLDELKRLAAHDATVVTVSVPSRPGRMIMWRRGGLIAASAVALSLMAVLWLSQRTSQISTSHGEQRMFQLPDASVVRLNSDSAVRVDFSRERRDIRVLHGQAYFEVAQDGARPFRVHTKAAVVTALGTEFDIYEREGSTRVTVTEGRVGIGERRMPLAAGEQARISDAGHVSVTRRANVPRATAWLRQEIAFEREPVAEVAAEFNRYNRLEIEVDDAHVATLPISGVFQSYDVRSFLEFLDQLPQVEVLEKKGKAHIAAER
jgi:transmembrane sensor